MARRTMLDQISTDSNYYRWVTEKIEMWAHEQYNGATTYTRLADFITRGEGKDKCERCLTVGSWIISDICCRCHRFICASCAISHHRLTAAICKDCFIRSYTEFSGDPNTIDKNGRYLPSRDISGKFASKDRSTTTSTRTSRRLDKSRKQKIVSNKEIVK